MYFSTKAGLLVGIAAAANASLVARQFENITGEDLALVQYFFEVCLPTDSSGQPDLNVPCNAVEAISTQCLYGSDALRSNYTDTVVSLARVSPAQEKQCFCGSQWFHMFDGCVSCANAHGVGAGVPQVSSSAISSFSSSYCAAANTPTEGLEVVLNTAFLSAATAAASPTATTFSDPIGSRTEVSLYFTPTVSGSQAYIVSQAAASTTAAPTGSGATTVSVIPNTSSMSGGQTATTAGASGTTGSSTGLAAVATPCLEKFALAGAVGLVGAVVML